MTLSNEVFNLVEVDEHGEFTTISSQPDLIRNQPDIRTDLDELSGLVREARNRGLNFFKRLGDRFTTEKERLVHGEFEQWIAEENAKFLANPHSGFEESIGSVENWMRLTWLADNHFDAYEKLRPHGATYMWSYASKLKTHIRSGKSVDSFDYSPKRHTTRTKIDHALDQLDDLGLSDLWPAVVESTVDFITDYANMGDVNVDGYSTPLTPETAKMSIADGLTDYLNRKLDHIKNNSNWQEPYSKVTELREIGNAFEELADLVMGVVDDPEHEIRLSISVRKVRKNGK